MTAAHDHPAPQQDTPPASDAADAPAAQQQQQQQQQQHQSDAANTPPVPSPDAAAAAAAPPSPTPAAVKQGLNALLEPGDEHKLDESFVTVLPDWNARTTKFHTEPVKIDGNQWRLLIFPQGQDANPPHLSVFLECCDIKDHPAKFRKCVIFSITVKSALGDQVSFSKDTRHVYTAAEQDWGYKSFVPLAELRDPEKQFIVNDTVTLVTHLMIVRDWETVQNETWANWNSRKETGFVGLRNQGATCYMNSLLQTLYFTKQFRKAVYSMNTSEDNLAKSVPLALQRVFFNLQTAEQAVGTHELTKSFGWDTYDSFMQHDVQEFSRVLIDNVETKMKNTPVEKVIAQLMEGKMKSYIRCINVDYESSRVEPFYDIQLNVKGMKDVYASFEDYVQVETLDGDNKYAAEGHGLQDAKKGVTFISLPPVLHLQLKRFEYDFRKDAMVKINDQFEFPEKLDLEKYLAAPEDTPAHYTLHSVLVHSGDVNGGHYVAFIKSQRDGKFYKFDDDRVSPATNEEAMEDNFGSSEPPLPLGAPRGPMARAGFLRLARRITNAYMLVYIRESHWEQVMGEVTAEHIPSFLSDRFSEESRKEESERKRRDEEHLYMSVTVCSDQHFAQHSEFDLVDFQSPQLFSSRVLFTSPFADFQAKVEQALGIPVAKQRFWTCITRENKTIRPDTPLEATSPASTMLQVVGGTSRHRLYVEQLEDAAPPAVDSKSMLLFFKYYDPKESLMRYLTHSVVDKAQRFSDLFPLIRQAAGLPAEAALSVYEEVKPSMIENKSPIMQLRKAELQHGDILCFERTLDAEEAKQYERPFVPDYFGFLSNRLVVEFRELDKPTVPGFKLELSVLTSYDEVSKQVGEKTGTDPLFLRFTGVRYILATGELGPAMAPISRQKISTLSSMLLYLYTAAYPATNRRSTLLFYEKLSMSIVDVENRAPVRSVLMNAKNQKEKELSLLVPKEATLQDVLDDTLKQVELPEGGSRKFRIFSLISGGSSYKEYSPTDPAVPYTSDMYTTTYYFEEIPLDQLDVAETDRLVLVKHFHIESYHPHGVPFVFRVGPEETVAQLRQRLQAKLDVNDKEFAKYGLAILQQYGRKTEFADENDIVLNRLGLQDMLGLDHVDKTPKAVSRYDRAIKIHN
ncbi:ubiquitin carboxyl-terminal hydrolase 5 [Capsaspora owczarzaki ATCC 30864]|uniref:ubiquitinyl hydrolase 1 n=1 Tax=Capsaspora owczarzaki (strain ATCC 30864) TaxID=595528 RepID=A0A0D2VVZ7_CAPO3|nr:ubiquitin carboxyl-terminal hydrolase 5 [Capsaspora owczarzaki ATCC 30864]KJE95662.1 ubiquitin carboxyl-terminal hydrolase 5 [Capsaspora owczarzaki ATCC 30864]|eukprot:XP_004345679.1 ubiquitin carboxyl-terminal hydrolase 5 [Capsaspora owczarzaki ATCC 30864]